MEPKIVLVTGGNKGIGLATCRELARAGHTVLLGARDAGRGRAAVAALAADGHAARFVPLDVTDQASVDAAAALVDAEYGRLDLLVNNAAITRDGLDPTAVRVADLRAVFETNVFGVVAVTNALVPLLRRSAAGVVANVSSGLGRVAFLTDPPAEFAPFTTLLPYNASKATLNALTIIYATALREAGITVVALSPGFVATDLNGGTGHDSPEQGGARIAAQALAAAGGPTGVFVSKAGGTLPW